MILETRQQHWSDEAACEATALALARHPALRRACIELHGPLGAGKTTFARHLLPRDLQRVLLIVGGAGGQNQVALAADERAVEAAQQLGVVRAEAEYGFVIEDEDYFVAYESDES